MRFLSRLGPWWAPALAFAVTLAIELALVDRKYAILSGGFGASQVLDRPVELGLFLLGVLLSQAVLIALFFLVIRALHPKQSRERRVFEFNFLFFTIGIVTALLAAKYQVLSYFSDAISFQLVRNLGGGSATEALLYVRDEAAQFAIPAVGAVIAYLIGRLLVRRFFSSPIASGGPRWKHLLLFALALPPALLATDRDPDSRYALTRFIAYDAADAGLAKLTDFDGDGYSWFGARVDTHPFDASRHPLALDVPGNGVDEDGYGGDFHFVGPVGTLTAPRLGGDRKHLVLIVLESVRGDSIGRRFAGREITPVLNALARQGSYVREAYSHVGYTSPSHKSLFSGALEPAMGAPSLFRDFKANGYRIGVISGSPEMFGGISDVTGMKANSDLYIDAETMSDERAFASAAISSLAIDGRKLLRKFDLHFSSAAAWRQPTFLYLKFQEAHFPYSHPGTMNILPGAPIARDDISPANRPALERTYWNAVAYDDWLIGQVIERLKRAGAWEKSLLVVTADHGESLFDDGFLGHGHMINRQQTQIPLILSAPGIDVEGPVGLADFRSILLRALGARLPAPGSHPVFQHIGPLDAPTEIGMVEKGGVWTTMMLETDEVRFSDTGRAARYRSLAPAEKARADRLIDLWARQRWIAQLSRQ